MKAANVFMVPVKQHFVGPCCLCDKDTLLMFVEAESSQRVGSCCVNNMISLVRAGIRPPKLNEPELLSR